MTIDNSYHSVAGIYKITCVVNNKSYIGSSVDLSERGIQHLSDLKHNRHHSIYLQRSFNKYGEDAFTFEVLATLKTYNETILRTLEYIYIEQFNPEFNGATPVEHQYSLEWRNKISESTKALYKKGYKNPRLNTGKKYKVLNYKGIEVATDISIRDAAALVGAKDYHFFNTVLKTHNGIACWKRGEFIIMEMSKTIEDLINYYKNLRMKNIAIYDSNGNLYNGKLTYKQLKLKEKIISSDTLQYIKDDVIYSLPCLIRMPCN